MISRGMAAKCLVANEVWAKGPKCMNELSYRPVPFKASQFNTSIELRKQFLSNVIVNGKLWVYEIEHKNNIEFLVNVVIIILKVKYKCKKVEKSLVSLKEEALEKIISCVQDKYFMEEKQRLLKKTMVNGNSKLATLHPIISNNNLIRVGGRIENSNLAYESKHPIVLPYGDELMWLLVKQIHEAHLHIGSQGLLAILRQKYWPLRGTQLAKNIVKSCYRCVRVCPRPLHQLMGNLPKERLEGTRPFKNTGIDFLGPIYIHHTLRGKKVTKSYVCVFVCFATKAVHLEVVSDLTTAAFVGALTRFVARRSCPDKIFCDNATNFIGAKNSLAEEFEIEDIEKFSLQRNIEWKFIPARSPHFGGLWEAAVKAVKRHFYKVVEGNLTYEHLNTIMTYIEQILNSRPLMPISDDPSSIEVLTPGHFLVGGPLTTLSRSKHESDLSLRDQWSVVKEKCQWFWTQWSNEYLTELQKRFKWRSPSENIAPDSLVLIKEDNVPPLSWRRGRVIRCIEGKDGICRVVEVRTSTGNTKRAIHKICPLPKQPDFKEKELYDQNLKPVRRSVRIKQKNCLASILLMLLILPLIKANIEIKNISHKSGIFFEHQGMVGLVRSHWNLVMHAEMKSYWNLEKKIDDTFTRIMAMEDKMVDNMQFTEAVQQLDAKYKRIQQNNEFIKYRKSSKLRRRRSPLAFMGSIMHAVFGVMDEEHAAFLEEEIQKGQGNDEYMLEILKSQRSIQNITETIMQEQNKVLTNNFDILNNSLYTVTEELNHKINSDIFLGALENAYFAMDTFESLQKNIIDLIWNPKSNFIEKLLPMERFLRQVDTVRLNLASGLELPDVSPITIGQISEVTTRTTNNSILFNIRIPLISKDLMELVIAHPFPTTHDMFYVSVLPETEFLLIDADAKMFGQLTEASFRSCRKIYEVSICEFEGPLRSIATTSNCGINLYVRNKLSNSCEIQITKPHNFWQQLYNRNVWLYSLSDEIRVNAVCRSNKTSLLLKGTGILYMQQGCIIKGPEFSIWATNTLTTSEEFVWPELNVTNQLPSLSHIELKGEMQVYQLPKIPTDTSILGLPSHWNLNIHDIWHYGMNTTTLLVVISGAVILTIILRRLCQNTRGVIPIGGYNF